MGLAAVALASPGTRWLADQLNHQPSLCPLFRVTGVACPSCGGTRAGLYLMAGDISTALSMNAGVTLFLVAMTGLVAAGVLRTEHFLGVANGPIPVADWSQ